MLTVHFRAGLILGLTGAIGALPGLAFAKFDPLVLLEQGQVRSEVVLLLDTSGSMASALSATAGACADVSGGDCFGDRSGLVDLCGDGLCSGLETAGSCATDCPLTSNAAPPIGVLAAAGQAPSCGSDHVSRFAATKRALRAVLPELRVAAGFALLGFEQQGYYRYYAAAGGLPSAPVSVFLTEWELRRVAGWDVGADAPTANFVWPTSGMGMIGAALTLTSGSALAITADSLYRRADDPATEARAAWATAGRHFNDGSHDWVYVGSYFTYDALAIDPANSVLRASYEGPQFTEGATTWVYERYAASACTEGLEQGIDGSTDAARVIVPLTASSAQSDHDLALGALLAQFNAAPNGGLLAVGRTPLAEGLETARAHLKDRRNGAGPFAAPDPGAGCRPHFVVVISDGTAATGADPVAAAATLLAEEPTNPTRTFVVALPGADLVLLDAVAAAGGTDTARFANDEQELVTVLRELLRGELRREVTTAAAGTATSPLSRIEGNLALLATTVYPGWEGRLRALDVATRCANNGDCAAGTCVDGRCELWDAGVQLATRDWFSRRLFSGVHDAVSGGARDPLPLLANDGSGTPCVTAGAAAGCDPSLGLGDLWTSLTASAPPPDLGAMVQWLAGRDRAWKLPPLINSVPAAVGPPPSYSGATGHSALESAETARRRIVYVASDEGLLHAFDLLEGRELYAFLPAHLLPQVYALYARGGQDADPSRHHWVLANSPRIEDQPDGLGGWHTYLVQTDGPGGARFSVLDITSPGSCSDPLVATSCTLNDPPLRVVFDADHAAPPLPAHFGQTFSVPALSWSASYQALAALGSGYDGPVAGEGSHYNLFSNVASPGWSTAPGDLDGHYLDGSGAAVNDYAVLADTVAVTKVPGDRDVIATYQADLAGRITRFDRAHLLSVVSVLDATDQAGPQHPFYFAPAALYRDDINRVSFAGNSGALHENDYSWTMGFETRLFLRTEDAGTVDPVADNFTCAVSDLCNAACYGGGTTPGSCSAPSNRALPISSPLLVRNQSNGDRIEAFYALYEPPTALCAGSAIDRGKSWLVRIDSETNRLNLLELRAFNDTLVSGLSIAGGGTDLVLTRSGSSGTRASIETLSGRALAGGGTAGAPVIESWHEVP
ncbi:MAG: hypothetical protein IPL40_06305 [Proteobacteria bacterium]|nr:hypothetical protein [Pseudomonadota bacterium]